MNISIDHELLSESHFAENESTGNKLLKFLTYAILTFTLSIILLFTLNLSHNIVHSYIEHLSQTNFHETASDDSNDNKIRVLSDDHEEITGNASSSTDNTDKSNINSNSADDDSTILTISTISEANNQTSTKIEIEIQPLEDFLASMNGRSFRGKWESDKGIPKIGENLSGEFGIKFEKFQDVTNPHVFLLVMIFRILNGRFIDNWGMGQGICRYENITATNEGFAGNYSSLIEYGRMFERLDSSGKCYSNVAVRYMSINNYTHLDGVFDSTCGFSLTFSVESEDGYADYWKVIAYSLTVSLMTLFQISSTAWVTHRLNTFQSFNTAVSYATVGENIIWNAFGCLSHLYLTVNYDFYRFQFGIPSMLFFASFAVFELKLLYSLWKFRNARYFNDIVIMRRKLVQFYFIFYIILFFSLFFVMKFYFDTTYIYIAISATWIPQIAFNAISYNKVSMPWLYVLAIASNRMLLPCYFRGCPENFFQLPVDYNFIVICVVTMTLTTFLMYSQTLFGPRWFLPKTFIPKESCNFYKSKEEIMELSADSDNMECVICLFSLFNTENYKYFTDDFIAAGENENAQVQKIPRKCKTCLYSFTFPIIEFHETNFNPKRKPYMMTPCRHFFHSACLESWFKHKKECPSCRQVISHNARN